MLPIILAVIGKLVGILHGANLQHSLNKIYFRLADKMRELLTNPIAALEVVLARLDHRTR